jgi:hypothetical protein
MLCEPSIGLLFEAGCQNVLMVSTNTHPPIASELCMAKCVFLFLLTDVSSMYAAAGQHLVNDPPEHKTDLQSSKYTLVELGS